MNAITGDLQTTMSTNSVSRRAALRGLGGAGLATALAVGAGGRVSAHSGHQVTTAQFALSSDADPASVIEAYIAAANAGDLEAILALYDDDAFHIALPSPDGSAGVCVGKEQFTMWYEQSLANGDRVELEDGSLAVDGNQATFLARITSEPWRELGLEALEAHSEVVVVDGRIMTHAVLLTPESVRQLQAARGA
ncbi:MAG TPA: nuclear transport factor 2 family protein [Thermomicrobiales bacterium]|nr:nuclear transport factor 2 family protein [Thermomicrobiales bacterium]